MGSQLPPGFRFHPTDEELVSYYLKRKLCGRKIEFNAIGTIDLYKYEPWDLPGKSLLQTRDLEWYFFNPRDRKFANSSRANRATEKGYWKATGKDRSITSGSKHVGMKKTLVYYCGRAPKGERTNWVMHEYRLNDTECERLHAPQNSYVLCRIYQKSGLGSRNGEQYGAPVEDDDNLEGNNHQNPVGREGGSLGRISDSSHLNHTIYRGENFIASKEWMNEDSCGIKSGDSHNPVLRESFGGESMRRTNYPSPFESDESILKELYQAIASSADDVNLDTAPSNGDFLELDDLFPMPNDDTNRNEVYPFSGLTSNLPKQEETTGDVGFQQANMIERSRWMKQDFCVKSGSLPSMVTEPSGGEYIAATRELSSFDSEEISFEGGVWTSLNSPVSNGDFLELDDLLQGSNEDRVGNQIYEEFSELLTADLLKQEESTDHGGFSQANLPWNASALSSMMNAIDDHNCNHQSGVLQRPLLLAENTAVATHRIATSGKLENSENLEFFESWDGLFVEENGLLDSGLDGNSQRSFSQSVGSEDVVTSFKDSPQHFQTLQSSQNQNPNCGNNQQENLQEIGHLLADTGQQWTLMSNILKYLETLPAFPASAADIPLQEGSSSERVRSKKETFVRQLSIQAAQRKLEQGSSVGFFMLAFLVVIWAILWLLIAGSAWKLVDGVYKFILSSK